MTISFLPRDAMHKGGLCRHAVSVSLSVCVSVYVCVSVSVQLLQQGFFIQT